MANSADQFLERLGAELKVSDRVLYFIQLDNLPIITLAHGHGETEALLDSAAKKLGGIRLMSDQMVISAPFAETTDARKTIDDIKRTFHGLDTHIASSINFLQVKKGTPANDALASIYSNSMRDNAIFSAPNDKEQNYNVEKSREHIALANEIKKHLKENKFRLAYQPIIEAKTGKATHYEALLRIEDNGKLRSAGGLIPIAEKMGLIDSIDILVLDMVIKELKVNRDKKIALNISNLTISNREWLKTFFDSITPDIGKRMIIEVTETAALKDIRETAYFIATLQDAGCMFALDDFGSGYTSFRQVRALSFDYIKIDGSLISDIATNPHNRLLVKALLEYMRGLNIKTVAEFVENGEVAKILMDFGIDYMQGNYFGAAA